MKATKAKKSVMPASVKPMLCTLLKEPFQDSAYLYEIKWDGYRIIARCEKGNIRLASRSDLDYAKKYPSVVRAVKSLKADIILDGEVVALNKDGRPDFDALQRVNGKDDNVVYYVFDLLWYEGTNLMDLPLTERKARLKSITGANELIRFSESFDDGPSLFEHARASGLEGIVAKKRTSQYVPDKRGKDWYKIPTEKRQEFVVGGWIESEARTFRTLLFGSYEDGKLKWIGHAGGGFKEKDMPAILARLKRFEINKSPFANEVEYDGKPHWVKPELVANIKYSTFTRAGKIRKPAIFLGFREDKKPQEVVTEIAAAVDSKHTPAKIPHTEDSNWPEIEQQKIRNEDTLMIDNVEVKVHNVDTEIWKGVTKAKLFEYYFSIADYILPYLKDRPLSLYVKLKGPHAPGLYIKDMEGREPQYASVFPTKRIHRKRGKRDVIDYLVCNNTPTLLYLIDLGCIDINPWTSTTQRPEFPDYIVIDLDPSDSDFAKAIDAAKAAKEFFDQQRLKAFIKTSGKTGIHLYLPCRGIHFHEARKIAETICIEINKLTPSISTTKTSIADRGNLLYLDPNQNDYSDTVAAPYSVRPAKHPTVSTPILWKELRILDPDDYTIDTLPKRLSKMGDLFMGLFDEKTRRENSKRLKTFIE